MNPRTGYALLSLVVLGILAVLYYALPATAEYNPQINPADFSAEITNEYFALQIGKKFTYVATTTEGLERTEIEISGETKSVMGVETLVYRDRVWMGDELIEDTRDYLAQDREGNVWYFGEDVDNYENGVLADHDGSWLAGTDGAKPGIWIKNEHEIGDSYRQEYYKGVAEDMRNVVATGISVETRTRTYLGCVKMYDWTPLDKNARELKYYCKEAGGLVLEENLTTGERAELDI